MVRSHRMFLKTAQKHYQACLGSWEEHPEEKKTHKTRELPAERMAGLEPKPFLAN